MPLARHALYAQNVEIWVAPTWDCGETWTAFMNHIAREDGCRVLSSATALESSDIPADFPGREVLFPDTGRINAGDAIVVKPSGGVVAGPLHQEKSPLIAELDLDLARRARKPGRHRPLRPARPVSPASGPAPPDAGCVRRHGRLIGGSAPLRCPRAFPEPASPPQCSVKHRSNSQARPL